MSLGEKASLDEIGIVVPKNIAFVPFWKATEPTSCWCREFILGVVLVGCILGCVCLLGPAD
jgi:hypothetical protein